ncbi:MAG: HdeD family acid-resistance protein [Methanoregula sp.]|uniref:HdeD family acid-resistance protein n=1 Tax=Methanoregula sp. TaxID=2052170 RepID=UPI003C64ACE9
MQEDIVIIATPFHPVKWGSFIARGLLALIIGILVLIWTGIAVQVVVTLIGILIILAAILALVLALKPPAGASRSVVLLVMGVLGLLVGIAAILYRWIAAEALTVIIALLMLFFGFIDLSIAIFHPEYTRHRFLLVFSGAISIILGGVFFFLPAFGAIVLVAVYLGIFAIIYGILSIAIGVMVKREQKKVTSG